MNIDTRSPWHRLDTTQPLSPRQQAAATKVGRQLRPPAPHRASANHSSSLGTMWKSEVVARWNSIDWDDVGKRVREFMGTRGEAIRRAWREQYPVAIVKAYSTHNPANTLYPVATLAERRASADEAIRLLNRDVPPQPHVIALLLHRAGTRREAANLLMQQVLEKQCRHERFLAQSAQSKAEMFQASHDAKNAAYYQQAANFHWQKLQAYSTDVSLLRNHQSHFVGYREAQAS